MGHREDLLTGARRALFEKGYARATARDIVALSGTNLGSIGYHYGSTRKLMTAAMLSALEEWGEVLGRALGEDHADDPADPLERWWSRVIGTVSTHRELWLASVEAMLQGEHDPELRAQIAAGLQQGRRGMAAAALDLTAVDEAVPDESVLDEATVRGLGSVQMALMSGVINQWLVDPATAPRPAEIAAGIRALSRSSARPLPT
ncbi:TetR/AcrR family transcriptional regulator [Micromonosporaceae bacterium Da 78-11]